MPQEDSQAALVRDPVCAMTVDEPAKAPSSGHDGHTFHFCSSRCRDKFDQEPEAYLEAEDPVCGMSVCVGSPAV